MSNSTQTLLILVLAGLTLVSLLLSLVAARGALRSHRLGRSSPLPTDLAGLRTEVERLRGEAAKTLRHAAVVRYDAFGDMGGRLSWTLALLDDAGDGVVLTSIHGRSDARSYAKNVVGWQGTQQLSPEEEQAIGQARDARS